MRTTRVWQCLMIFLASLSICLAASPTSFCKCTCFSNSTVVPLDDSKKTAVLDDQDKVVKKRTCADCNKQFCLDYNFPMCARATEADVFTQCFQRDSRKDEAVVFIFIFVTVGLMTWAGAKPYIEKWQNARQPIQAYAPVNNAD